MSEGMQELALESLGCLVSFSSCGHEEVASSKNIIDGSRSTFWTTTGLYPQSFIISFPTLISLSAITIRSYCVRNMLIERCSGDLSTGFVEIKTVYMQLTDLHHQVSRVDLGAVTAQHLRFTIKNGFQEFCAIYKATKERILNDKCAGRGVGQAVTRSCIMWPLRLTRTEWVMLCQLLTESLPNTDEHASFVFMVFLAQLFILLSM